MTILTRRAGMLLVGGLALAAGIVTATPAVAATLPVAIVDNNFQPRNITIDQGDVLVWTNTGQRQHTVTADDGSFNSGPMNNGQTFSRTFTTPGTFAYFCAFHGNPGGQGQAGTITVRAVEVTTTTTTTTPPAPTTTVAPAAAPPTTVAPAAAPTPTTRVVARPARAPAPAAQPTLPRTGASETLALALFGAGFVLIGIGAMLGTSGSSGRRGGCHRIGRAGAPIR